MERINVMSLNNRYTRCQVFVSFLFASLFLGRAEGQSLDATTFEKWHRELLPQNNTWKKIPWQTSLVEAQRKAVNEKRPIFIWAMDGHPLGCT